jgi:hypothetical protein
VKLDPGAHVFYAFGFALKSGCDNIIQDVGYYAPRGPNLSKLCATCLFLRVTDLGEATFIYFGYSP